MSLIIYNEALAELAKSNLPEGYEVEFRNGDGKVLWDAVQTVLRETIAEITPAVDAINARHEAAMREALEQYKTLCLLSAP